MKYITTFITVYEKYRFLFGFYTLQLHHGADKGKVCPSQTPPVILNTVLLPQLVTCLYYRSSFLNENFLCCLLNLLFSSPSLSQLQWSDLLHMVHLLRPDPSTILHLCPTFPRTLELSLVFLSSPQFHVIHFLND